MLNNGDKLIVTKKVADFLDKGEIVKVVNETEDGVISFAFGENFVHMGVMSHDEAVEHFEVFHEEETPSINEEYIADIMENSEFEIHTVFDKCTVVSCRLPNGFVITESSACVSPENYDEDTGAEICFDKIANKIWELEAYRLQQLMWENERCCDECEGCPCDDEDCCEDEIEVEIDVDEVDCEHCDDYNCLSNPNRYIH